MPAPYSARACLAAAMLPLLLGSAAGAPPDRRTDLFVSPSGRDTWSGRLPAPNARRTDGPFASVARAQQAARDARPSGSHASVTVFLRGGTYRLARPIRVHPLDSYTTFAAYRGERPILSGGRVITGWKRGTGNLWSASVPSLAGAPWEPRQIWVNGHRRTRARTPNKGYFRLVSKGAPQRGATGAKTSTDRTAFVYAPGDIRAWPDLSGAEVVVYHSWETSRLRVALVDEAARVVSFTGPAFWPFQYWEQRQRYFVENVRAALDAPGEWYLDRKAHTLLYYPMPGEDMRHAQVVAPALTRLVDVEPDAEVGVPDRDRYVYGVTFSGISFQHQDWTLEPEGHSDTQAVVTAPAAIMLDGARGCRFVGCEIARVGDYALWLRRGCKQNRVERCRVHDMGVGGLRIGEAAMAARDEDESSGNVLDNNHIYDGGYVYPAGVGIWVAQSSHNRISHNEIHDLNYSGMSIGWNWDDSPNRTHHNVIEYNHVHHVVRGALSDAGAIYTLGVSTGSVIRGNVLHDVWPYATPPFGWGIYLDSTTGGYLVENNVVYNTMSGGLMYNNGGHEHVIRNNVFARGALYAIWPFWEKRPNTFEHNIVYQTQGTIFPAFSRTSLDERIAAKASVGVWDRNLYWTSPRFFGKALPDWRATAMDLHSVVADPGFVNAAAGDFRLKPTSPARKLGIRSIDTRRAGLYGPAAWVNEARALHYPPTKLPAPPPAPKPLEVLDGFEGTVVGGAPKHATVSGEQSGASIRVSDEQAASGKHSLKFTDSSALERSWEPHVFYEPHIRAGAVRQSFDVMLEPRALLFTEWRDVTEYPSNIGPSVTFTGDGRVNCGGKVIANVPVGRWVHVEITASCGPKASTEFRLSLTPRGAAPQRIDHLPFAGTQFHELHWLGFVSNATVDSTFYIDNVQIVRVH